MGNTGREDYINKVIKTDWQRGSYATKSAKGLTGMGQECAGRYTWGPGSGEYMKNWWRERIIQERGWVCVCVSIRLQDGVKRGHREISLPTSTYLLGATLIPAAGLKGRRINGSYSSQQRNACMCVCAGLKACPLKDTSCWLIDAEIRQGGNLSDFCQYPF